MKIENRVTELEADSKRRTKPEVQLRDELELIRKALDRNRGQSLADEKPDPAPAATRTWTS